MEKGVTVLQVFTYKLSCGFFFVIKCKDSHQNGLLCTGFCMPFAARSPSAISCHAEAEGWMYSVILQVIKAFPMVMRPSVFGWMQSMSKWWGGDKFSSLTLFALLYAACTSICVWILTVVLQCIEIVKHNLYKDISVYLYVF